LFGKSKIDGANLVAVNGVFNCCGRLVFPMVSDIAYNNFGCKGKRFSPATARRTVFIATLAGQLVIVSFLSQLIDDKNYNGFTGAMWVLTTLYGAGFGTIPAFIANMYGPYNVGALHGLILTAWSIGGVGGGLAFTGNYNHLKKSNIQYVCLLLLSICNTCGHTCSAVTAHTHAQRSHCAHTRAA